MFGELDVRQTIVGIERQPAVIVVDSMVLRRAGILGLLREWAEANRVSITPAAPDTLDEIAASGTPVSLGLLSLGGEPMSDPGPMEWLRRLMSALPETPVVVLSDRDVRTDVVAALTAGARGFIPTTTGPEVALRAFTFIMYGGSYFPPEALLCKEHIRMPRDLSRKGGLSA